MSEESTSSVVLAADPRSVRHARELVDETLTRSGAEELRDVAALAVSELVTNALVHAGTDVRVDVRAGARALRVEVVDGGVHHPMPRHYAETAGTGRGLHLVSEVVDRWGVSPHEGGKAVWFEIGSFGPAADTQPGEATEQGDSATSPPCVDVTLRQVPLLMHVAWQEHAATLLREFLLQKLDEDTDILEKHAEASDALRLLGDQLPAPVLSDDPDGLMAHAIEPGVTAGEVVLRVPTSSVAHFDTLDVLLRRAIAEAQAGRFLSPPTQPEIDEMRQWLCREVAEQAAGATTATPWVARTDVRATLADQTELTSSHEGLSSVDEPLLATDEASIIVAASPAALRLLGYDRAEDLLGRRVIVVVPQRFHQAHIAGTTLNATNGRDKLLGVPITVPMVRADGVEVPVEIEVRAQLLNGGRRVFVARFQPV